MTALAYFLFGLAVGFVAALASFLYFEDYTIRREKEKT